MPWFKVDDGFHAHRKVARLGREDFDAIALWTVAGSWCADQLTDGWVPEYVAAKLDADYKARAGALVRVGLWEVTERDGEPGWLFHQWSEDGRQPTAEQVKAERTATAERQRRFREKVKGTPNRNGVTNALVTPGVTEPVTRESQSPFPSVPFPSVPLQRTTSAPPVQATVTRIHADRDDEPEPLPGFTTAARPKPARPDRFADFWKTYPRKKAKGNAEKSWTKAIEDGVDPQLIIDAALVYRMERNGQDPQFTKLPATWLNQRCWEDEADPPYTPPADTPSAALVPRYGPPARADDYGGDAHMARFLARAEAREAAGERGFL